MTGPLPTLVLYRRSGCHLCDDARATLDLLLAARTADGLLAPAIVERDIDLDDDLQRRYFASIPVVELGDRRLELAISAGKLRRFLDDALDGALADGRSQPGAGPGSDGRWS